MWRGTPLVLQADSGECGLAALTMVAAAHGHDIDLASMRKRFPDFAPRLGSMLDVAGALGLAARPLRVGLGELRHLVLPAILHWEFDHFVVLVACRRRSVVIHDPAAGRRRVDASELGDAFTGVAIEIRRSPEFSAESARSTPGGLALLGSLDGLGRFLGCLLLLLFAAQALALVPPVAMQLLIDELVLGRDTRWLHRLVGGVALAMLAALTFDYLRRRIALYTGVRLATDTTAAVVRHLLRLPAATIERRSTGDFLSRIESLRPLRAALTDTLPNVVVQATILLTTLAVMTAYSRVLAGLASLCLVLVVLCHVAVLPRSRSLSLEGLVAGARSSNSLIETLRAYATVQAMGLGAQRLAHWQHGFVTATNARAGEAGLAIRATVAQGLVAIGDQALFLAVGIDAVIGGELSVGALFAFLSLRQRFSGAALQLVSAGRDLFLLRPHVERVAELLAEAPQAATPAAALRRRLHGAIEWSGLEARYPGRPAVFTGSHGTVEAGEWVVLEGHSGAGKSTLLRLLSGNLAPASGSIRYDGVDAGAWDRRLLLRQFGVVLQSDRLFEGTIADNVCGFDVVPDVGRLRDAAMLAAIWDDLQALPMTIHTPVSASGGLSGGQVQRLLIARALYREPRVLFLDEATSHLDAATERRVLDALGALDVTIISVAHRHCAVRAADRVITVAARPDLAMDSSRFHNARHRRPPPSRKSR